MQIYRFFTRFAYFTRTTNINSFHNKRYIRNTYKLLNKSSKKFKYYPNIYIERSNFFQITQIYDRKDKIIVTYRNANYCVCKKITDVIVKISKPCSIYIKIRSLFITI